MPVESAQIIEAPGNVIDGPGPGTANVVPGLRSASSRSPSPPSRGTVVAGNFIGTDPTKTVALGNALRGVLIHETPNNLIGATADVFSGNGPGVSIAGGGAVGSRAPAKFIGTRPGGTAAPGNAGDGLVIDGAPGNAVGRGLIAGTDKFSGALTPQVIRLERLFQ
jgi:hypothetical protein